MNKYICKGRALLVFLCILLLLVVTLGSLIFNCVSTKENVGAADIRNQGSASIILMTRYKAVKMSSYILEKISIIRMVTRELMRIQAQ